MRFTLTLDGDWQCVTDPDNSGLAENWASSPLNGGFSLRIPGCIQQAGFLSADYPPKNGLRNSYLGSYWLEKNVFVPHAAGNVFLLSFGGVAPAAFVWVNGKYAGKCGYGQIAVALNVTSFIEEDKVNRFTVAITEDRIGLMGNTRFNNLDWSGLFRGVELSVLGAVFLDDLSLVCQEGQAFINGVVRRSSGLAAEAGIRVGADVYRLENNSMDKRPPLAEAKGTTTVGGTFSLTFPTSRLSLWSCESPNLYHLKVRILGENDEIQDEISERVGFRFISCDNRHIYLNAKPLFIAGTGEEYFSPTISPLTDKEIIRSRWQAMKEHGFNFFRYHTHVPTDEELDAADEAGILVSSEIGLVSNFGKTLPVEGALTEWKAHVRQTRCHPSVFMYCLGNEGSQLMVKSQIEQNKARIGYEILRKNAPGQLAIIAFGMQGELPELPNDIETPHLWSSHFAWGYDGLTRIPWKALRFLEGQKPMIIHEYGKFGVWPDMAEEAFYPQDGYSADFGRQARAGLEDLNLLGYERHFIDNSRKLSLICHKIVMEEARAQPAVSGYTIWTIFRKGSSNTGIIDDMGHKSDSQPELYRDSVNAPIAILIDRGFSGRTLAAGSLVRIRTFVSNFGKEPIRNATLIWSLDGSNPPAKGEASGVTIPLGENKAAGVIAIEIPQMATPREAELKASLKYGNKTIALNSWNFWLFPSVDEIQDGLIVYDFKAELFEDMFLGEYPNAIRAEDFDSMTRGCRTWTKTDYRDAFEHTLPDILVTDHPGTCFSAALEYGIPVFCLDSGSYPERWYTPPLSPETGKMDPIYMYSSFRAGWDQGNLATVIQNSDLIAGFPHKGFCDLQFFGMCQGAKSLARQRVSEDLLEEGEGIPVIWGVSKMRKETAPELIVQDPNAIKESILTMSKMNIIERTYLLDMRNDKNRVVVSTLKFFQDISGRYLLHLLLLKLCRAS
jgi:hypothetical protein